MAVSCVNRVAALTGFYYRNRVGVSPGQKRLPVVTGELTNELIVRRSSTGHG